MHHTSALILLQHLAKLELLETRGQAFFVPAFPRVVHESDVRDCFYALASAAGHERRDVTVTLTNKVGLSAHCKQALFAKLFKVIFLNLKILPKSHVEGSMEERRGGREVRDLPLPTLFVGAEKTQVRQIPLVDTPPWPFRFLLELGGMVVIRPKDTRDALLELRQFLNNYPQYRIKVDAKEWPDGSVAIFTWWFEHVPRLERRENVNVPHD